MPDPKRFAFAALLIIETDDPLLGIEALAGVETIDDLARIRAAVVKHLPRDVQRVVAVMPVHRAQAMMELDDAVGGPRVAPGRQSPLTNGGHDERDN